MINEGIKRGIYEQSTDTAKQDLEIFPSFLYRNFKNHPSYIKMRPKSNQLPKLHTITKIHKFNDLDEITVEKIKLRQIVDQTCTTTYDAAKVNISRY